MKEFVISPYILIKIVTHFGIFPYSYSYYGSLYMVERINTEEYVNIARVEWRDCHNTSLAILTLQRAACNDISTEQNIL